MKSAIRGTITVKVEQNVERLYNYIDPEQDGLHIIITPGSDIVQIKYELLRQDMEILESNLKDAKFIKIISNVPEYQNNSSSDAEQYEEDYGKLQHQSYLGQQHPGGFVGQNPGGYQNMNPYQPNNFGNQVYQQHQSQSQPQQQHQFPTYHNRPTQQTGLVQRTQQIQPPQQQIQDEYYGQIQDDYGNDMQPAPLHQNQAQYYDKSPTSDNLYLPNEDQYAPSPPNRPQQSFKGNPNLQPRQMPQMNMPPSKGAHGNQYPPQMTSHQPQPVHLNKNIAQQQFDMSYDNVQPSPLNQQNLNPVHQQSQPAQHRYPAQHQNIGANQGMPQNIGSAANQRKISTQHSQPSQIHENINPPIHKEVQGGRGLGQSDVVRGQPHYYDQHDQSYEDNQNIYQSMPNVRQPASSNQRGNWNNFYEIDPANFQPKGGRGGGIGYNQPQPHNQPSSSKGYPQKSGGNYPKNDYYGGNKGSYGQQKGGDRYGRGGRGGGDGYTDQYNEYDQYYYGSQHYDTSANEYSQSGASYSHAGSQHQFGYQPPHQTQHGNRASGSMVEPKRGPQQQHQQVYQAPDGSGKRGGRGGETKRVQDRTHTMSQQETGVGRVDPAKHAGKKDSSMFDEKVLEVGGSNKDSKSKGSASVKQQAMPIPTDTYLPSTTAVPLPASPNERFIDDTVENINKKPGFNRSKKRNTQRAKKLEVLEAKRQAEPESTKLQDGGEQMDEPKERTKKHESEKDIDDGDAIPFDPSKRPQLDFSPNLDDEEIHESEDGPIDEKQEIGEDSEDSSEYGEEEQEYFEDEEAPRLDRPELKAPPQQPPAEATVKRTTGRPVVQLEAPEARRIAASETRAEQEQQQQVSAPAQEMKIN